jgi:hypothetical protein
VATNTLALNKKILKYQLQDILNDGCRKKRKIAFKKKLKYNMVENKNIKSVCPDCLKKKYLMKCNVHGRFFDKYLCKSCINEALFKKELRTRNKVTLNYHYCILCGSKEKLEQHHILGKTLFKYNHKTHKFDSDYYSPKNIVWLCHDCHLNKAHQGDWQNAIDYGYANKIFYENAQKRYKRLESYFRKKDLRHLKSDDKSLISWYKDSGSTTPKQILKEEKRSLIYQKSKYESTKNTPKMCKFYIRKMQRLNPYNSNKINSTIIVGATHLILSADKKKQQQKNKQKLEKT